VTTNTPSPTPRPQASGVGFSLLKKAAFPLCAVALYVALSLVKMRHYYKDGRFWAEEGRLFVRGIYGLAFPEALLWLFHGHLELVTNLIVYLS